MYHRPLGTSPSVTQSQTFGPSVWRPSVRRPVGLAPEHWLPGCIPADGFSSEGRVPRHRWSAALSCCCSSAFSEGRCGGRELPVVLKQLRWSSYCFLKKLLDLHVIQWLWFCSSKDIEPNLISHHLLFHSANTYWAPTTYLETQRWMGPSPCLRGAHTFLMSTLFSLF